MCAYACIYLRFCVVVLARVMHVYGKSCMSMYYCMHEYSQWVLIHLLVFLCVRLVCVCVCMCVCVCVVECKCVYMCVRGGVWLCACVYINVRTWGKLPEGV